MTWRRVLGWLLVWAVGIASTSSAQSDRADLDFELQRSVAHSGFDGNTCWVHARAGVIPEGAIIGGKTIDTNRVVLTTQKLLLSGSDVFYRLHQMRSDDAGNTWSPLRPIDSFARQTFSGEEPLPTGSSIAPRLLKQGDQTTVCDFTPQWHVGSQRLLGIGQTVWYRNNRVMHTRPRGIAYAVYDHSAEDWGPWKTVRLPSQVRFQDAGAGSAQRVDLPGGDVLVPFYCKRPEDKQYSSLVCRCRFDGETLLHVDHGNALTIPVKRGLYEPSLTRFDGRYFMTMRNDDGGFVSVSQDGLQYGDPVPWKFDDGSELGSYNTQQHWVTHQSGLFLVYTRRGADNDHVFRHRAPLFIARVDPKSLRVIRSSERVLVPERGARLGNFGVVDISEDETWVIVAEWMQPSGVEKHGSDNTIHVARLHWSEPNRLVSGRRGGTLEVTPSDLSGYARPPSDFSGQFGTYASPLRRGSAGSPATAAQWHSRRQELAEMWKARLGEWPPLNSNPEVQVLATSEHEGFTRRQIRFRWTPNEWTTGYLSVPEGEGPFPAVVSVFYEPETAIGQGKPYRDFASRLTKRGFVTLSIGTSEATAARTYALFYPSREKAEVQPLSMLAHAAANAWHVLASESTVDSKRIGIVGHSFGGKWAMFGACLFERYACAAWSDPGIVFDERRPSVNYWEPWYLGYHPPPWRKRGVITADNPARGLYPRLVREKTDLHLLHALMPPRPFLVSGGSEDPVERWQALNHTRQINQLLGVKEAVYMTNRPDHSPNADSNAVIDAFFEHHLRAR